MKRAIITLVLIVLSINIHSQTDKDLVLESFKSYKNAVLNDKGDIAVNYVDSRTMNYYSNILNKVKNADSLEVNAMGIIDKITVLTMKHKTPKRELIQFNNRDLFVYAIDNGMIGKDSVINAELGEVTVNGDFSKAEFIVNGQTTPFFFHFYKEDKIWKMDITHLFSLGTIAFKKMIEDSGQNENDFIINILELLTGNKPKTDIWKPLIRQ